MVNSKKHIVFLIASRDYGGYEVRYFKLAYYLFNKGYKISVLVNANLLRRKKKKAIDIILSDKEFSNHIYEVGYPYLLHFQKSSYFLLSKFRGYDAFLYYSIKILEDLKSDIVITNKNLSALKILREKLDVTIAKDFTSPDNVDSFYHSEEHKSLHLADLLLFVSETVENRFREKFEKLSEDFTLPKIFTAQLPFFYPIEIDNRIEYSQKKEKMIFAHRLLERKNPILFAKIVKRMCADRFFNNWNFSLYGRGEKENEVKKILKKEILNGRVEVGYKHNLIDELKSSKIFFSLIEPDSFPSQSLSEAMFCGNAIVVLNRGKSGFYINDNGIIVEKDINKIIDKLKLLISNDLKTSCFNSIKVVKQKLNMTNYEAYIIKVINEGQ